MVRAGPGPWPEKQAGVAQLVEHVIRNDGVGGSSPFTGTRIKTAPKRNARFGAVFFRPPGQRDVAARREFFKHAGPARQRLSHAGWKQGMRCARCPARDAKDGPSDARPRGRGRVCRLQWLQRSPHLDLIALQAVSVAAPRVRRLHRVAPLRVSGFKRPGCRAGRGTRRVPRPIGRCHRIAPSPRG